ncbi:hypothetical protein EB796_013873 [Bugula neritina]|uniref:Uncharacterized protein n=1 Tax=Bugula neritina TaxID=10212 RepID=A0A7J7JP56_BUGNE|nr:hypothetical protein EB796_013873 [Bugula neritina]
MAITPHSNLFHLILEPYSILFHVILTPYSKLFYLILEPYSSLSSHHILHYSYTIFYSQVLDAWGKPRTRFSLKYSTGSVITSSLLPSDLLWRE